MNLCEIGLFHVVWGSKGTRDNYHEILWKYCFGTKIYQYIWISGGYKGDVHGLPHIFLFTIQRNWKSTRAWPILKSNSTSFWFKTFFPWMNNKKNYEKGAPLLFLYEVSIVVLIDFIAILALKTSF